MFSGSQPRHCICTNASRGLSAADKQASKFIRQNNIMTILIQDVNYTMAGYQKEILPSSWSPIVKYSVYNINSEVKEALGANIKPEKKT